MRLGQLLGQATLKRQIDLLAKARSGGWRPSVLAVLGPDGLGKRMVAETIARLLLCTHPELGHDNCCCKSCRTARTGNHPDLETVELRLQGTIDTLRNVVDRSFRATERKVVVLYGIDTLRPDATQTLLKVLEEPSGNTCWVLTGRYELPPTVRSRSVCLRVGLLRDADIDLLVPGETLDRVSACGQVVPTVSRLTVLHALLASKVELLPDRVDDKMLASDLRLGLACLAVAARNPAEGVPALGLKRLSTEQLWGVSCVLTEAATLLAKKVRPWLVAERIRNQTLKITSESV